ncbi:MAG: hypothetical protein EOO15_13060, partial [Chitinophagaceae bacterium]
MDRSPEPGRRKHVAWAFVAGMLLASTPLFAQNSKTVEGPTGNPPRARVVAGPEYRAGGLKRAFLGRHYRAEWTEPVWVPVLNFDTLGGLTPIQQGGGRQTRTLRLKDAQGRQYVLRSVNKNYGGALPE